MKYALLPASLLLGTATVTALVPKLVDSLNITNYTNTTSNKHKHKARSQDFLLHAPPESPSTTPNNTLTLKRAATAGLSLNEAAEACGDNAVLSCCSQTTTHSGSPETTVTNSGLLSGLLGDLLGGSGEALLDGGLALLSGCLRIPVDIGLINLDDLLDNQCQQSAACCSSGDVNEGGLIDVSVGCISLEVAVSLL